MGLVPVSVRVEVSAPDHVTYRETVMMESYHEEIVVTLAEVEVSPPPPVGNLIPPPAPPTVPDSVDAGCDDLVGLEAPSMMVELSGEQQACLEELLRDSTDSERRSRISRTLILNARGGDQGTWERLMVRHPQEVSSDDPDACLQYAMHRHRADDGSEQEVLELAARALAQQQWDRADIAHRLGTLHELRTRAASRRWEWSRAEGAPEREQQQHRAVVEVCAMEWLAHARASGASAEAGKALCLAAAEDPVRCQE